MLAAILFEDATGMDVLKFGKRASWRYRSVEGRLRTAAPRHRPYAKGWSIICWSLERRSRVAAWRAACRSAATSAATSSARSPTSPAYLR